MTMRLLESLFCLLLVMGIAGCEKGTLKPAIEKNELVEVLKKDNWLVLPLPDTKMSPGTVVFFREGDLRYLGHLSECGVPASVIEPVRGQAPDITSTRSFNVGLDFSLKLMEVPAGADASLATVAVLKIDDSGADEISLIRLRMWLADPENELADVCKEFFEEGAAMLSSAFRVASGSFELKKEAGASAGLSDIEIAKVIDLDAKGNIKNVGDGKVTFEGADYYIAFKRVVPLDRITFLGPGGVDDEDTLDAEIGEWLEKK